jgi:hypothetical protein
MDKEQKIKDSDEDDREDVDLGESYEEFQKGLTPPENNKENDKK